MSTDSAATATNVVVVIVPDSADVDTLKLKPAVTPDLPSLEDLSLDSVSSTEQDLKFHFGNVK